MALLLGRKSVAVLTFDDHLNMRKLMSPAFNPKGLARGVPRLVQLAEEHCNRWAQQGELLGARAIKAFTFHVRFLFVLTPSDPPQLPPLPTPNKGMLWESELVRTLSDPSQMYHQPPSHPCQALIRPLADPCQTSQILDSISKCTSPHHDTSQKRSNIKCVYGDHKLCPLFCIGCS